MKKILSIALTIGMVFGVIACAPVSASAAYVYAPGDYTYNVGGTFYFEAPYDGWYAFESYDNYDPYLYVEYENGDEETFDDENGYEFRANIYLYEGEEIYCRVGTYEGADQNINFNIDAVYDVETNRDYTIASDSYFTFTAPCTGYFVFESYGENDPCFEYIYDDIFYFSQDDYDYDAGDFDFYVPVYLYEGEQILCRVTDYDGYDNICFDISYEGTCSHQYKDWYTYTDSEDITYDCYVCEDCWYIFDYEISKPETPIVSAANAVGGITVSWDWVAGATKYNVYRRAAGSSSWVYVGTTEGTSFFDKNVSNGKYYAYSVRAYNDAGRYSDYVAENTYTIKCVATPKLTKIQNATSGIRVDWTSVPGATGYRVYRRGAGSTSWYYLGTTTNLWFVDSAIKNASGNYYRYTVRAVNSYFSGFDTNGLYIKRLSDPASIKAVNETSGIKVSWGAVKGAGGYRMYRRASGQSSWTFLGTTTQNSFVDTKVTSGTYYRYTVKAYSGSTYSSYNTSGALTIRLSNPGSLSATQSGNGVKVAWGRVNGATSYRVYRRGAGESSWTYLGSATTNNYYDKTIKPDIYYRYTVRAVRGNVYSGFYTDGPVVILKSDLNSHLPLEMYFSSGAGGWRTYLKLNKGGSFTGEFTDSDMGDNGPGYPNGTVYICNFSGKFTGFQKVNDYTYTMRLSSLNRNTTAGRVWYENGIKYVGSSAAGIEGGSTFYLYLPNTPKSAIPEEAWGWAGYYYNPGSDYLGGYCLYNVSEGTAFFTSSY